MIYCGKTGFGQISRSFSLNSGAIRLKRPKNLTQTGLPSLQSVKSDRLLAYNNYRTDYDFEAYREIHGYDFQSVTEDFIDARLYLDYHF